MPNRLVCTIWTIYRLLLTISGALDTQSQQRLISKQIACIREDKDGDEG